MIYNITPIAHRKPGEKIYDFAITLQLIFKHAYPDGYTDDSFKVILGYCQRQNLFTVSCRQ